MEYPEVLIKVKEEIHSLIKDREEKYVTLDGEIAVEEEQLFEDAFDYVVEDLDLPVLTEIQWREKVHEALFPVIMYVIMDYLEERYSETILYQKDPYAYNGVSRSDFY